MGLTIDRERFEAPDYRRFERRLDECLVTLGRLLEQPGFGTGPTTVGAELELFLVDAQGRALPRPGDRRPGRRLARRPGGCARSRSGSGSPGPTRWSWPPPTSAWRAPTPPSRCTCGSTPTGSRPASTPPSWPPPRCWPPPATPPSFSALAGDQGGPVQAGGRQPRRQRPGQPAGGPGRLPAGPPQLLPGRPVRPRGRAGLAAGPRRPGGHAPGGRAGPLPTPPGGAPARAGRPT
jgi:hypothetical protein